MLFLLVPVFMPTRANCLCECGRETDSINLTRTLMSLSAYGLAFSLRSQKSQSGWGGGKKQNLIHNESHLHRKIFKSIFFFFFSHYLRARLKNFFSSLKHHMSRCPYFIYWIYLNCNVPKPARWLG